MILDYTHEFPILQDKIYLDHAAVAPLSKRCVEAGKYYLNDLSLNGHKNFPEWINVRKRVKTQLAQLLNTHTDEIALTKNTSEGLLIVANGMEWKSGDNVILFANEFPANVYPWTNLKYYGVETRFVPEKNGAFQIEDIKSLIDKKTKLIAVSFVEFSTGFKNDLKSIGELCKENNITFVVDAIQGMGVIPIDVKDWHIDFLSSGGHKWLMSGLGTGCFYANSASINKLSKHNFGHGGVEDPFDFLKYHQKPNDTSSRFEDGMFNIGGTYIMEAALNLLLKVGIKNIYKHTIELTEYLIESVLDKGYKLLTPIEKDFRSAIISFYSENHDTEKIYQNLIDNNIVPSYRRNAIRVSPHFYNTKEHIEHLIEKLPKG